MTPWLSSVFVTAEKDKELSPYKCYLPVAEENRLDLHFDVLKDALIEWCALLRPAHGSAGYNVILELAAQSGEPYCYPFLQRHPGLNLPQTVQFIGRANQTLTTASRPSTGLIVLGDEKL